MSHNTHSTFLIVLYRLGTLCGMCPYRMLVSDWSSPTGRSPSYAPGTRMLE
jgi:hypothetical protein